MIQLRFTAEEVADRTQNINGQLYINKRIESQKPFYPLVNKKMKEKMPSDSEFKMVEAFKKVSGLKESCYTQCQHQHSERMPISYEKADLQAENGIAMIWLVKCKYCLVDLCHQEIQNRKGFIFVEENVTEPNGVAPENAQLDETNEMIKGESMVRVFAIYQKQQNWNSI